jgi:hypothetical protein
VLACIGPHFLFPPFEVTSPVVGRIFFCVESFFFCLTDPGICFWGTGHGTADWALTVMHVGQVCVRERDRDRERWGGGGGGREREGVCVCVRCLRAGVISMCVCVHVFVCMCVKTHTYTYTLRMCVEIVCVYVCWRCFVKAFLVLSFFFFEALSKPREFWTRNPKPLTIEYP